MTLTDRQNAALTGTAVYDGTAFSEGKATFRLADGETKTIGSLPEGYHYLVTEEAVNGFESSSRNETGTIPENDTASVTFTNTKQLLQLETNSFTLRKVVDGNGERNDETYSFTVSLQGLQPEQAYTLSDGTGYSADTLGRAMVELTLADGDELSFTGLPVNSVYQISEAAGDYLSAFEISNAAQQGEIFRSAGMNTKKDRILSTSSETVDAGEEITVTYTNTKDVRQDVTVRKLVENGSAGSEAFSFRMELNGLSPNELVAVTNIGRFRADDTGSLDTTFFMGAGEEAIIKDLPVGATYRLTEEASDYISSFIMIDSSDLDRIVLPSAGNERTREELSTAVETVNEGEEVTVTFTNYKVQRDLTVTKTVDMTYGNLTPAQISRQTFDFVLTLTGLEPNAPYSVQYTAENATGVIAREYLISSSQGEIVYDFRLIHGCSCTFKNLPENASYQVTESAAGFYASSYAVTGSEGAVFISASDANELTKLPLSTAVETVEDQELNVNIVFTNTYSLSGYVLPNAGLPDKRLFLSLGFAGMLLFGVLFVVSYRHKRKTGS